MDEKLLFELRPQLAVAIIPTLVSGLIVSLIAGFWVGSATKSVIAGFITFLILFFVMFFFRLMNLKARRYLFFKEKAEFYEGFLNIVQRTVRYTRVTDYVMVKTVWDRIFGTGTIKLVTAGHEGASYGGYSATHGGGLVMSYIKDPDTVNKKLETLLKH